MKAFFDCLFVPSKIPKDKCKRFKILLCSERNDVLQERIQKRTSVKFIEILLCTENNGVLPGRTKTNVI